MIYHILFKYSFSSFFVEKSLTDGDARVTDAYLVSVDREQKRDVDKKLKRYSVLNLSLQHNLITNSLHDREYFSNRLFLIIFNYSRTYPGVKTFDMETLESVTTAVDDDNNTKTMSVVVQRNGHAHTDNVVGHHHERTVNVDENDDDALSDQMERLRKYEHELRKRREHEEMKTREQEFLR